MAVCSLVNSKSKDYKDVPAARTSLRSSHKKGRPKRGKGRPSLLTPERETRLLARIAEGLPLRQAANLAGMSYETLNRWRIQGEAKGAKPEFRHFWQSLRKAQALAMERLVSRIQKAARKDWKAAAWLLERRHADEFARPQRMEHSGPGGSPIATVNLGAAEARNHLSDEALSSLVRSFMRQEDSTDDEP